MKKDYRPNGRRPFSYTMLSIYESNKKSKLSTTKITKNKMEGQTKNEKNKPTDNSEGQLSPEVLEKVMEKVQDVNRYGTAWSIVPEGRLKNIFTDGLLGVSEDREGINRCNFYNENSKELFISDVRKRHESNFSPDVYFNVVGRQEHYGDQLISKNQRISDVSYYFIDEDALAILFDLSSFQEVSVENNRRLGYKKFGLHEHFSNPEIYSVTKNDKGESMSPIEYGFRLSPRMSPRLIQGLLFYKAKKLTSEEILTIPGLNPSKNFFFDEEGRYYLFRQGWFTEENNDEILEKRAKEIVIKMFEAKKTLVPVYDYKGNLWWPKRMSYEEVKRFVEERDKQKEDEK